MSKPAAAIGWGFAGVAVTTSAAYAYTIPKDPYTPFALVAISVLAVAYERYALVLARRNRLAKDWTASGWGYAILAVACLYTASMQLGFFSDLIIKPIAADHGQASTLKQAEQKVIDLEQRRGWLDRPNGTVASLERLIASIEDSKRQKDIDAVRQARKDLAAAEALDAIEADLATARGAVATLRAAPPADTKGAVIEGITFGAVKAEWASYVLVMISVLFLQACQILLPIVSGEGREKQAEPKPEDMFPGDRSPAVARRIEDPPFDLPERRPAAPAKRIEAAAPKQIAATAPQKPAQAPPQAALPPPRRGGLANRIKQAG